MSTLRVSDNRRCLVHDDGSPFFYLADTAWELFHRLNREEATFYLEDRASKGFTAIQAVILAECDGLTIPNAYGHLPLEGKDPRHPIEVYFEHVDYIVDEAARLGLHMAILPTWGSHLMEVRKDRDKSIFDETSARSFGAFLGKRYRDKPIIWVLGGDRAVLDEERKRVMGALRAMAEGIRSGGSNGLMTFHPPGSRSSSQFVHDEPWLDFNMMQSGHSLKYVPNWQMLRADYEREPVKPVLDGEPCYENHPVGFTVGNPIFDDHDVRCAAYWAVFAGACGHTYGCHDIWMMRDKTWQPHTTATGWWYESVHLPGAAHMGHLRRLMESRPQLTRIPDWQATDACARRESDHIQITRDGTPGGRDATYIMAYTPLLRNGRKYDTTAIAGKRLRLWAYDPRTGRATLVCECDNDGSVAAPSYNDGPDWVFVIDDADAGYPPPGSASLGR